MTLQDQFFVVGDRLFTEIQKGLGDDLQYLTDEGVSALATIGLLLGEAAVRGQMGEDVTVVKNALEAALGNWESVAYVKAADRADAIRASVMTAIGDALEVVLLVGLKAIL